MDVIDRGASYAVGIRKKAGSRSTAGATGVSEANASRGSDDESNSCEPIIQSPFCTRIVQIAPNLHSSRRLGCARTRCQYGQPGGLD